MTTPTLLQSVREVRACKVDGCTLPFDAKGYCSDHYKRWKNYGDPMHPVVYRPKKHLLLADRIMDRL